MCSVVFSCLIRRRSDCFFLVILFWCTTVGSLVVLPSLISFDSVITVPSSYVLIVVLMVVMSFALLPFAIHNFSSPKILNIQYMVHVLKIYNGFPMKLFSTKQNKYTHMINTGLQIILQSDTCCRFSLHYLSLKI